MKAVLQLFKRRKQVEHEVEEELSFHFELLRKKHLEQGLSPEAACRATRQRFGDPLKIKRECVAISRRSHPVVVVLKAFFAIMCLTGFVMRVAGADGNFNHLADVIIAVAVSAEALIYARGLTPARFLSKSEPVSLSLAGDGPRPPIAPYDGTKRTPIERVFADK